MWIVRSGSQDGDRRRPILRQLAVDVVLDHDQVVPARDARDRLAARERHARGGRIVHGRIDEQQPCFAGPSSLFERLGQQALVVDRHAVQTQTQALGDVAHAGVGQGFGQDRITGAGEPRKRRHDRLMGAAGDDDPIRRRVKADPPDPGRRGGAMIGEAAPGRIGHEVVERAEGGDLGEPLREQRPVARVRRRVERQLDQVVTAVAHRIGPALPGSPGTHIGAAADLSADQAALRHQGVGAAHRADGDAQSVGEVALRRQAGAFGQSAGGDVVGDRLGQGAIARPGPGREIR